MISTFKRNRHFRKVLVNKTFTHVQEQKKSDVATTFRLYSVQCKITFMNLYIEIRNHIAQYKSQVSISNKKLKSTYITRNGESTKITNSFGSTVELMVVYKNPALFMCSLHILRGQFSRIHIFCLTFQNYQWNWPPFIFR